MKTVRVILKVPFHKHPAGTVFHLAEKTEPADWPENEIAREKQNFSSQQVYYLPDGGRGFAVSLPVGDTMPCPEHVFTGTDIRKGECRATLVQTQHGAEAPTENDTPPCGRLQEANVSLHYNPALKSTTFRIDLPPFAEVAEKMVLWDRLENRIMMEHVLRNYKHSDTQLTWDVSDLSPGFYELRICFPGDWFHVIRFIKAFPLFVDPENIPPAPRPEWQPVVDRILEKFQEPQREPAKPREEPVDLPNEALSLCLEWGPMFNQPTQERMMERHPDLRREQADELDRLAREVRSYVYNLCEQELEGKIAEHDLHFTTKRQYPWVNSRNFNQMKSVGMYYARR